MDLWLAPTFSKENVPDWSCPFCRKGFLRLVDERFHTSEIASGRHVFSGFLKCSDCGKEMAFAGRGRLEHVSYTVSLNDHYIEEDRVVCTPTSFSPPFPLFRVDERCSGELREQIDRCFDLYWIDLSACAAGMIAVLDGILEGRSAGRAPRSGGRRQPAALRRRIDELKRTRPEIAKDLLSIPWIARDAAPANRFDILNALEPLERSIRGLLEGVGDPKKGKRRKR